MRMFVLACGLILVPAVRAAEPGDVDHFEARVRPILVEQCGRCHGDKKQMGGLRLDTAAGMRAGSDTGPVIAGDDPSKSALIQAIRRTGDYPMPPDKPLSEEAVAAIEAWVARGAVFPEPTDAPVLPEKAITDHWAFRPVADPPVPKIGPADASAIDRFLLEKLAPLNAGFAPPTDRRTLLRRVAIDLTGLPPTADELDAFVADNSPDAFAEAVDRLLASPHYGERWGRHWLDVARYADTKGYVFQENRDFPYAYTYRDYVIRSLNDDKPYNQFVKEQLAADKLDLGDDPQPLAALGFLTLGRRFINNVHDIIDDRIDVVTRGLLGLTVQCSRCHDHKFDPIPTTDYYALYGVFASSTEPRDLPLLGVPESTPGYKEYETELTKREQALETFRSERYAKILEELRSPAFIQKYLVVAQQAIGQTETETRRIARDAQLRSAAVERWRAFLQSVQAKPSAAWVAWIHLAKAAEIESAVRTLPATTLSAVRDALTKANPKTLTEVAAVYAQLFETEPEFKALLEAGGAVDVSADNPRRLFDQTDRNKLVDLQRKVDGFKAASPFAPARAMVLVDAPKATEPVVFLRGSPDKRGPAVPRRAPAVIDPDGRPFTNGSGRLELAERIVDPANPLTARVIVNRVWGLHFGRPLVGTPSDFGFRSDAPTHPELLDWLAKRFVTDDNWSLKKLHRRIVLTQAYQQSGVNPIAEAADPENKLLGRRLPRRLDFESMRDAMLVASGSLDKTVYGRSVDLLAKPYSTRRAVYASIDRQNLPATFRTFDFASPDTHSPGRTQTSVPQQALFFLNNPFVLEQAAGVVKRADVQAAPKPAEKVRAIYRAVLGRDPTDAETRLAGQFTAVKPVWGAPDRWQLFAQALLMSNEFCFAD